MKNINKSTVTEYRNSLLKRIDIAKTFFRMLDNDILEYAPTENFYEVKGAIGILGEELDSSFFDCELYTYEERIARLERVEREFAEFTLEAVAELAKGDTGRLCHICAIA